METENELTKLAAVFPYLSYRDKLKCFSVLTGLVTMEEDRPLLREVVKILERAYHPMAKIESWIERRFTEDISLTPKQVIHECRVYMKLRRGVAPLLWAVARKVKKRVKRQIEKEGKGHV